MLWGNLITPLTCVMKWNEWFPPEDGKQSSLTGAEWFQLVITRPAPSCRCAGATATLLLGRRGRKLRLRHFLRVQRNFGICHTRKEDKLRDWTPAGPFPSQTLGWKAFIAAILSSNFKINGNYFDLFSSKDKMGWKNSNLLHQNLCFPDAIQRVSVLLQTSIVTQTRLKGRVTCSVDITNPRTCPPITQPHLSLHPKNGLHQTQEIQ